jgi:hypothetical protein
VALGGCGADTTDRSEAAAVRAKVASSKAHFGAVQEQDRRAIGRAGFGVPDAQQARIDLLQRAERGARGHILLLLAHFGCGARRLPVGASDGPSRLEDVVGDRLRLGDHDHVRALDLDDVRAGPLSVRPDDVGAGGSVAGGDHGPGRQLLPGGRPDTSVNAAAAAGRWVAAISAVVSGGRSAAKASRISAGLIANSTEVCPSGPAG